MKKTKNTSSRSKKMEKKPMTPDYELNAVEDKCCDDGQCCEGGKCGGKRNIFKALFFLVVLIAVGYFAFVKMTEAANINNFKTKVIPAAIKQVIGEQKLDYRIDNVVAVSGIYKFDVVIKSNGAEQRYSSFITQDGKIFFVSGVELKPTAPAVKAATQQAPAKMTCADLPKSATPKLTAFIVSTCPYGLQTQRLFKKIIADAPAAAANLAIKYIGSIENGKIVSMHGDKEAQENLKQICLREEQPAVFIPYVSCFMQEGKGDECVASTGVNVANLNACTADKNRGLKYAQADFDLANKFQVGGSPTLLLNDQKIVSEYDFGGRNEKAIQSILCCSGANKLPYCGTTLGADDIAISYSKTDLSSATAGSAPAAACATQ